MKSDLYLGIDQGSSSTKGVCLDSSGTPVAEWSVAAPATRTEERCVEQDPEGILNSVLEVFLKAKQFATQHELVIRGAGLAVQRSGVLAWRSQDGEPVHPVITWADTRTYPQIQALGRGVELITNQTGLPTIANFAAPKIHLLQRQFLDPIIHVATLDTFLLYRLSGRKVFVTEDTMASRTMLYALTDRNWSEDLCRHFKVDKKRLPRINPSLAPHTSHEGVPIAALLGDQQAALIGRMGQSKRPLLNLGTIASLVVATGAQAVQKPGLKTSVLYSRLIPSAAARDVQFLTEVTSSVTGNVLLEPLRRSWCNSSEELHAMCEESFQENPVGLATAYFIHKQEPSDVWPHGVPNVMVCKPGASTKDRVRAVVENVGNLIVRMIEEMAEKGLLGEVFPTEIDVAGGGSELDFLMQYIADVSGQKLRRLAAREAGTRGAALAALMSIHCEIDIRSLNTEEPTQVFSCQSPERRRRYMMWQRMEQDVLKNTLPAHAEIEA